MNSVARIVFQAMLLLPVLHVTSAFGNTVEAAETGTLYPTVVSLVLMLGAAVAATVFLRRWKGSVGRRAGPMQLRHVLALGPRERLALVKVGSRFLVVGVTAAGISAVAEFTDDTLDVAETVVPLQDPAPTDHGP